MPRPNKPWYRKSRKRWYVKIDGTCHNLGPNKREAMQKFHELMAEPRHRAPTDSVVAILDAFVAWSYENRAPTTAKSYQLRCQSFADQFGDYRARELDARCVAEWLDQHPNWNASTRHAAITAVLRAFNWAVKNFGLRYNPIRGVEKPTPNIRTTVVTPEEFEAILTHVHDQPFRDLLIVSWDAGARPQETRILEARHIQLDKQRAVIPADEAKKGIQRAIYFPTERSLAIISRLVREYPGGFLFRNRLGNGWDGHAVCCRFKRLEKKIGVRYRQYDLRHTFITRKLLAGVDSHVVARLAGHQNTAMLDKVYSHVADDYKFMLREAKKDIEDDAA